MPFVVACTSCGTKFRVSDNLAGKEIKCSKCGSFTKPLAESGPPTGKTEIYHLKDEPQSRVTESRPLAAAQPSPKIRRKTAKAEAAEAPKGVSTLLVSVAVAGVSVALLSLVALAVVLRNKGDGNKEPPARADTTPASATKAPDVQERPPEVKPVTAALQRNAPPAQSAKLVTTNIKRSDAPTEPGAVPGPAPLSGERIYQRLIKSTLYVRTSKGSGSGALIDRTNRLAITCQHVVGADSEVLVLFPTFRNGRLVASVEAVKNLLKSADVIRARVVARETSKDLALIQLDHLPETAMVVPLAATPAAPGQTVHSVGNPGKSAALWEYTSGSVRQVYPDSWKDSSGNTREAWLIATQSPINPGDSGGPLVNDRGELVGVASAYEMGSRLVSLFIEVREVRRALENYSQTTGMRLAVETGPALSISSANVNDLIAQLARDDSPSRAKALKGLAELGPEAKPAVPVLVNLLKDEDEGLRRLAREVLEGIGKPSRVDVPFLAEALKDESAAVRSYAATALGLLGPEASAATQSLRAATKDKDANVRRSAMIALAKIGLDHSDLTPDLLDALNDVDNGTRKAVINAIGNMGTDGKAAVPFLAEALKSPARDVRESAVLALRGIGTAAKAAVPMLKQMLADEDEQARFSAALALAEVAPAEKDCLPVLVQALQGKPAEWRNAALAAIAKIGPLAEAAVPDLVKAMRDADASVRLKAVEALGAIGAGAKAAIIPLIDNLKDEKMSSACQRALERMGKVAIPNLCDALRNRNVKIRAGAAEVLGNIGPDAKSAIIPLTVLVQDRNKDVREAARSALTKIQQK